ncbi:MAG: SAM-dependent methyltransferase [Treponema sp.]|nr:MAG: SAM-dependent methyltransferase [Treponema sp.]
MKANYGNWMPKGMLKSMILTSIIIFLVGIIELFMHILRVEYNLIFIPIILLLISLIIFWTYLKFKSMYKAFDLNNEGSLAWRIIHFVSDNVKVKDRGSILDVGCGSGALAIDCAKKHPNAKITGLDKWGGSYKSFTKEVCEANARVENVLNIDFIQGSAVKLPFEDETFDAVTSNFVYHNIPGNRQNYILETLRVLKKGGYFAIHDIFVKMKYGNLDTLLEKIKALGFEKVEFIDTCTGTPISQIEAKQNFLSGSKLLTGIK